MLRRMSASEPPRRHWPEVRPGARPPFPSAPWQAVQYFWNRLCPAVISAGSGTCAANTAAQRTNRHADGSRKPLAKAISIRNLLAAQCILKRKLDLRFQPAIVGRLVESL